MSEPYYLSPADIARDKAEKKRVQRSDSRDRTVAREMNLDNRPTDVLPFGTMPSRQQVQASRHRVKDVGGDAA